MQMWKSQNITVDGQETEQRVGFFPLSQKKKWTRTLSIQQQQPSFTAQSQERVCDVSESGAQSPAGS